MGILGAGFQFPKSCNIQIFTLRIGMFSWYSWFCFFYGEHFWHMSNFEFVIIRIHRKMLKTNISATYLMLKQPDNGSFHFFDLDMTFKKSKFVAISAYMQMKKRILKLKYIQTSALWNLSFQVLNGGWIVCYISSFPFLLL